MSSVASRGGTTAGLYLRVVPPLVSVIVPVHDGERFLPESLPAITAQTHQPVELVVVDDGSTDGSARVAGEFVAAHGIGVVHRRPQGGVAAARNAGLELASGEYLAFCDQDDVWHPEKIARQLAFLDAHPRVGAVMTRQEPFFADGVVERPSWLKRDSLFGDLGGVLPLTALIRREAFDVVGGFTESRPGTDDLDWFLRARRRDVGIAILDEVLVRRRIHGDNASYDVEMLRRGLLASLHALTHDDPTCE
jgi:glycosyltransferase involved in cell wall biosynthesis